MKKALILGASINQVPLIKKTKELGFMTYVASNIKTDIGLSYADKSYLISILDYNKLKELIIKENVTIVVTCASDLGTTIVAKLNEYFAFPGLTSQQVESVSIKNNFLKLQEKLKLHFPKSITLAKKEEMQQTKFLLLRYPIIIKPTLSSGSKGVYKINNIKELQDIYNILPENDSINIYYVAQEFLEGKEYGCECVIQNQKISFIGVTNKYLTENHVPFAHFVPNNLNKLLIDSLKEQILKIIKFLNIKQTLINIDFIVKEDKVYIIDFSFRSGGNHLTELMKLKYGVDEHEIIIKHSLGKKANIHIEENNCSYASLILGSDYQITFTKELKTKIKNIFIDSQIIELVFDFEVNTIIETFNSSNKRFGSILLQNVSETDVLNYKHDIDDLIEKEWNEQN